MGAKKPLISESNSTFGFFYSYIYSHPKGNFNLYLYSILAPYFMPKFVFIKRLYTLPLQYVKSLKIEIKRQKKEYAITHTLLYIILPNYLLFFQYLNFRLFQVPLQVFLFPVLRQVLWLPFQLLLFFRQSRLLLFQS